MKNTPLYITMLALLAGCSTPDLKLNTQAPDFYSLDPDSGNFCEDYLDETVKGRCTNLLISASYIEELGPINQAYKTTISGPRRLQNLIHTLTSSDAIDYPVSKNDHGVYKLGINHQTKTVWKTIRAMHQKFGDSSSHG